MHEFYNIISAECASLPFAAHSPVSLALGAHHSLVSASSSSSGRAVYTRATGTDLRS